METNKHFKVAVKENMKIVMAYRDCGAFPPEQRESILKALYAIVLAQANWMQKEDSNFNLKKFIEASGFGSKYIYKWYWLKACK